LFTAPASAYCHLLCFAAAHHNLFICCLCVPHANHAFQAAAPASASASSSPRRATTHSHAVLTVRKPRALDWWQFSFGSATDGGERAQFSFFLVSFFSFHSATFGGIAQHGGGGRDGDAKNSCRALSVIRPLSCVGVAVARVLQQQGPSLRTLIRLASASAARSIGSRLNLRYSFKVVRADKRQCWRCCPEHYVRTLFNLGILWWGVGDTHTPPCPHMVRCTQSSTAKRAAN
jgi:hypothetical protein